MFKNLQKTSPGDRFPKRAALKGYHPRRSAEPSESRAPKAGRGLPSTSAGPSPHDEEGRFLLLLEKKEPGIQLTSSEISEYLNLKIHMCGSVCVRSCVVYYVWLKERNKEIYIALFTIP